MNYLKMTEGPRIKRNLDGPKILKAEVRAAINKMKKKKAAGPDKIVVEMISTLDCN